MFWNAEEDTFLGKVTIHISVLNILNLFKSALFKVCLIQFSWVTDSEIFQCIFSV